MATHKPLRTLYGTGCALCCARRGVRAVPRAGANHSASGQADKLTATGRAGCCDRATHRVQTSISSAHERSEGAIAAACMSAKMCIAVSQSSVCMHAEMAVLYAGSGGRMLALRIRESHRRLFFHSDCHTQPRTDTTRGKKQTKE